jgi:hypothetical protein
MERKKMSLHQSGETSLKEEEEEEVMTEPVDTQGDDGSQVQEERREEAEQRNPDLHGEALEALEGNEDGTGRTPG